MVSAHIALWCPSKVAIISITLLNNIFLGVQSLYRRCPNLQGMETRLSCQEKCDFLHRHGVRCYARARVELVQIAFTARAPPITTSLFLIPPWQPLTPYATIILGYAAVNVQRSCRRERRSCFLSFRYLFSQREVFLSFGKFLCVLSIFKCVAPLFLSLGYAAVNGPVDVNVAAFCRFGLCSLNEKCSFLSVSFCVFCQFSSAWRHCFCPLATQLSTVLST